jgi:hypothetical protein
VYYEIPSEIRSLHPEVKHCPEIRAELSLEYSRAFLLKPHALLLSHQEQKPLEEYFDPEAISQASTF